MTASPKIEIAIPSLGSNPDMGIHRSLIKGKRRYRIWWWENGVVKARIASRDIVTIEQAREVRDTIYARLVAAGAGRRNRGARTPEARIRNAKLSDKHAYIQIVVSVRGVRVGSFRSMEEAVAARDAYLVQQSEIRRQLAEVKRARA